MAEVFCDGPESLIEESACIKSALISKNVRIHRKRTSVRLEPEMWSALKEIAAIETCSIHDLCGAVHDMKEAGMSFTAALRVFLMEYYRTAARSSPRVNMVQRRLKAFAAGAQTLAQPDPVPESGGMPRKIMA
jgi:predicted DNA-binding ribbon-helix-helix protein